MTTVVTNRSRKGVAVSIVGIASLLLGAGYAFLGGVFIFSGVNAIKSIPDDDSDHGWGPFLKAVSALVAVIGVAFVVPGVTGILAGTGVLLRKQWGRILTFAVALLAIVWGLGFMAIADRVGALIGLGAAQILYGVAAFVVLIRRGDEFRRSARTNWPNGFE